MAKLNALLTSSKTLSFTHLPALTDCCITPSNYFYARIVWLALASAAACSANMALAPDQWASGTAPSWLAAAVLPRVIFVQPLEELEAENAPPEAAGPSTDGGQFPASGKSPPAD